MDFFKKTWVEIVAFVMLIISVVMLALGGFTKVELTPVLEGVFAVLDCVSLLIIAIKKLLQKKDSTNK